MNGIEMMLKSMGFDPEKIKATLTEAKETVEGKIAAIDTKLESITASLQRIELKLDTLPQEEVEKIIASKTPEEIQKELEITYGRNNGNGD